ncbi:MAG TPA: enoyl-CoA hydratase [bacterium]|nr:enoyl-CoA hydratase [bacterium]
MKTGVESNVGCEIAGGVCTIRFDRVEKKNALTVAMYARIVSLLEAAAADSAIRVVLLTGAGSAFTAGNDLGDFLNAPPTDESSPVLRMLHILVDFEKPIVAAVNGLAIGVGTTLLLHCDLVLAAASARFQMPFVALGLVPEGASSVVLPRMAGMAKASELLLLGEPFDAATAKDAGIASEIVADAELGSRALERAAALAAKPPEALRAAKRLLREPGRRELHDAISREASVFRERLLSEEAREAFSAFLSRRR